MVRISPSPPTHVKNCLGHHDYRVHAVSGFFPYFVALGGADLSQFFALFLTLCGIKELLYLERLAMPGTNPALDA